MERVRDRLRQPRCEECGDDWSDPRERWHAFRIEIDGEEPVVLLVL